MGSGNSSEKSRRRDNEARNDRTQTEGGAAGTPALEPSSSAHHTTPARPLDVSGNGTAATAACISLSDASMAALHNQLTRSPGRHGATGGNRNPFLPPFSPAATNTTPSTKASGSHTSFSIPASSQRQQQTPSPSLAARSIPSIAPCSASHSNSLVRAPTPEGERGRLFGKPLCFASSDSSRIRRGTGTDGSHTGDDDDGGGGMLFFAHINAHPELFRASRDSPLVSPAVGPRASSHPHVDRQHTCAMGEREGAKTVPPSMPAATLGLPPGSTRDTRLPISPSAAAGGRGTVPQSFVGGGGGFAVAGSSFSGDEEEADGFAPVSRAPRRRSVSSEDNSEGAYVEEAEAVESFVAPPRAGSAVACMSTTDTAPHHLAMGGGYKGGKTAAPAGVAEASASPPSPTDVVEIEYADAPLFLPDENGCGYGLIDEVASVAMEENFQASAGSSVSSLSQSHASSSTASASSAGGKRRALSLMLSNKSVQTAARRIAAAPMPLSAKSNGVAGGVTSFSNRHPHQSPFCQPSNGARPRPEPSGFETAVEAFGDAFDGGGDGDGGNDDDMPVFGERPPPTTSSRRKTGGALQRQRLDDHPKLRKPTSVDVDVSIYESLSLKLPR